ncbi:MAG: AtpZ/AtpI family protein [Thermoflexales bacterium]|nr:AtpZ/AtpI family protein [Thermoflexales bacterium]MDW8394935.1 AtpZ/AtpI family protein [Anaerolineae bacterium]
MQSQKQESPLVIFIRAFPPQVIGVMVVQIALINGALMLGGVLLGMSLDAQLGTRPLLTVALPLVGAVFSLLVAYRVGIATVVKARKAYLAWVESKQRGAAPMEAASAPQLDAH